MIRKFDFDDILIEPTIITDVISRKDINPLDNNGFLPLITAPMDTVVNTNTSHHYWDNKIKVCLPRGEQSSRETDFTSYSLTNFVIFWCKGE